MKKVFIIMSIFLVLLAHAITICSTSPNGDVICIDTEGEPTIVFGPDVGSDDDE